MAASQENTRVNALKFVHTVHALGFIGRVDEAAECSLELLAAGSMRHAAQTGAVPVDLASLWVERALVSCLLLQLLR